MPLRGAASDKYGNRFEGKWTIYCLAKIMAEEADTIRLEPPGDEGEGCEFAVSIGETTQYHQVKRQHSGQGGWSITDLRRNGVLATAFDKTYSPQGQFIFVSSISANLLDELTDAARKAESPNEFTDEFLSGHKKEAWEQLLVEWRPLIQKAYHDSSTGASEEEATRTISIDRLRRIYIYTLDEKSLTETVNTKLRTLVRAEPDQVREGLAAYSLENIHKTIHADDLWSWANDRGYRRVDYEKDASVLATMQVLNERYESMIKLIGEGISITRSEANTVMDILLGGGLKNSVLVSGEAGIGKTVILGQTIQQIRKHGIPHLYFRVDRLDSTELPQNIGAQLGLPASPVEVLANVAKERPSVLVIDQLDAVSLASGRNPEFFECIHEIIQQAQTFPTMRLLMACRRFDLDKDNRLRELILEKGPAQEVKASLFSADDVKTVLGKLGGYQEKDFSDRQIELLRLPLHLAIFAQVYTDSTKGAAAFADARDLFDAYWNHKRQAVARRTKGHPDQWTEVLDRLCDTMNAHQTLFVHEETVLDDFEQVVRAMESEHVLVLDERRVGFFHEGFFDYVFARRFIARGGDLVTYLKTDEQHLFKRAPLRQILLYQYGVDQRKCIGNLRRILNDSTIRLHLKKCALDAASRIDQATPEFWELLCEILQSGNPPLVNGAWEIMIVGRSWFPFLHSRGMLTEWLSSENADTLGSALRIVANQIQVHPEECVSLLRPYVGRSDDWNRQILHIVWHRVLGTSRPVFDLFLEMVHKGAVGDQRHQDFWSSIYDLPKNRPEWAAEAIGIYLLNILEKVKVDEIQRHFLQRNGTGKKILLTVASQAPKAFLDHVLPFFLNIVTSTAKEMDGKLHLDPVWGFRMYLEDPLCLEDALLLGLETALRKVAAEAPDVFMSYFSELQGYGNYDSVNFLLVRAFAVASQGLSDTAIEYVLENPRRLEVGWASSGGGEFSHWAARELVEHCTRYCGNDTLGRLESVMLNYFPRWERSKEGYKIRGYWQFIMLPALDPQRRSSAVNARISECQRKFPNRKIRPPEASRVEKVSSPIEEAAARKMSDEQWLRAIAKYDTEDRSMRRPDFFLQGGAHQLSLELEAETKRDPERFVRLCLRFPANAHPYYFQAVLRGLRDSAVPKALAFDVVRAVFNLPTKPGGRYLCEPVTRFSDEDIPDDIMAIIGWLATEADDPKTDELKIHRTNGTEEDQPSDILTTAINSVRGTAAEALGTLLFDNAARVPFFMPYLKRMVGDPTVIVRTTVAHALLCLYRHDETSAVDLFLELADVDADVLFATHHVDKFLYYATIRHFERLRPILRRMLDSDLAIVREAGALRACLAQFSNPSAKDLVDECLMGDEAKRKGAVRVAEANAFNSDCREFSHSALVRFFSDPVKEIRDTAATCFHQAEGCQLETCRELIRSFLKSPAFGENVEEIIRPLEHSTADISEEIIEVCEAIVAVFEHGWLDLSKRLFIEAETVSELVLRAYRQSDDDVYRSRCLDLVDRLVALDVYGISKELEAFER